MPLSSLSEECGIRSSGIMIHEKETLSMYVFEERNGRTEDLVSTSHDWVVGTESGVGAIMSDWSVLFRKCLINLL